MLTEFLFAVSHALLSKKNGMGDSSSAVAMMPEHYYGFMCIKHHLSIQLTCTHLKAKIQNTLLAKLHSKMGVIQQLSRSFFLKLAFLKFSFQGEKKYEGRNLQSIFKQNDAEFLDEYDLCNMKYIYIAIFQRMPDCLWFQCPDWIQTQYCL